MSNLLNEFPSITKVKRGKILMDLNLPRCYLYTTNSGRFILILYLYPLDYKGY